MHKIYHEHASTSEDDLFNLLSMLEETQTLTRFDKSAKTYRTTSFSGPLLETVMHESRWMAQLVTHFCN